MTPCIITLHTVKTAHCYAEFRYAECRNAECRYAECRYMLSVVQLSVMAPTALSAEFHLFLMNKI